MYLGYIEGFESNWRRREECGTEGIKGKEGKGNGFEAFYMMGVAAGGSESGSGLDLVAGAKRERRERTSRSRVVGKRQNFDLIDCAQSFERLDSVFVRPCFFGDPDLLEAMCSSFKISGEVVDKDCIAIIESDKVSILVIPCIVIRCPPAIIVAIARNREKLETHLFEEVVVEDRFGESVVTSESTVNVELMQIELAECGIVETVRLQGFGVNAEVTK